MKKKVIAVTIGIILGLLLPCIIFLVVSLVFAVPRGIFALKINNIPIETEEIPAFVNEGCLYRDGDTTRILYTLHKKDKRQGTVLCLDSRRFCVLTEMSPILKSKNELMHRSHHCGAFLCGQ